eukprot:gnl/TRDRNA2_/TRDRNA2_174831_c0_seq5.p1 gnl/TRDRNA2_/TRDRNA2_174831_c0~~gnl/TRDRNA2_/TRDRNA2_174831_c0_seq5.p1  ORF type:complete len:367 (-),score=42.52 gnl/TRDRNA2_/TRDRNA2_174831_c0_seq5:54-1154(-)
MRALLAAATASSVELTATIGDTCEADARDHCIVQRPGTAERQMAPGPGKDVEAFLAGLATTPPCELPIVDYSTLSRRSMSKIVKRGRPVIFGNISSLLRRNQPHDWSKPDFLTRFGQLQLAGNLPDTRGGDELVTFADVANATHPARFFITRGLWRHVKDDLTDEPALLYSVISNKPVFALGGAGTWNRIHKHGAGWQAQIHGSKLWWLAPQEQSMVPETNLKDGDSHWGGNVCGYMRERPLSSAEYCLMTPGHAIFVPHGYFHGTCNLDEWTLSYGMQGRRTPMARAIIFDDIERYEALAEKCSAANRKRKHRHVNDNGGTESYKNHCDREDFEEFGSPLNTAAAHGNTNMILHLLQRLHNKSAH